MAKSRLQKTAREIISEECEAGVHREFPSHLLDQTLQEITRAAKQGNWTARKVLKLLNSRRFKK